MKVNKSAHFQFDDEKFTVAFGWGKGKSLNAEFAHYTEASYPTAKRVWEEFLAETDLREKMAKLAHAINMGSEDKHLQQLCFMLEVMWRYDFSKKEA